MTGEVVLIVFYKITVLLLGWRDSCRSLGYLRSARRSNSKN